MEEAATYQMALTLTTTRFKKLQRTARLSSSVSEYVRAVTALESHEAEYRGLLAVAGEPDGRRSAFNWFKSAASKQLRPSMMMPPMVLYPLELRVAQFHMAAGEYLKAAESFKEALARRPNDLACLVGYKEAFLKMERPLDAETIQKQIDAVVRD
jgi:tetratricopeptide (TPR) repeat protein